MDMYHISSPCHLVSSALRALTIVMTRLRHFTLSAVTSLRSAKFIPVDSCIVSIHLFLGRPCFLIPSPHASINSFSSPFDLMTWPKNLILAFIIDCSSVSSFTIPAVLHTQSLVLFSIHDILNIFLHNHDSQALIFFSIFLVKVHDSLPYVTIGMIRALTSLFFVSIFTFLSFHIFSMPFIAFSPNAISSRSG